MSQEDLELVRQAWEAWERGDMKAILAFYDQDIVWDFSRAYGNVILSDEYHGHDGVRRFFREWPGAFDGYYAHAEEFIDAGGGSVLVRVRQGGRGNESGIEIDMPYWQVYRVRDGRAVGDVAGERGDRAADVRVR
jgi:ketosteroid isomerase-like protein